MSTALAKDSGLPLSLASAITKISKFSKMLSEIRCKIELRSSIVVLDQLGKAFSAAFTAKAISRSSLFGILE